MKLKDFTRLTMKLEVADIYQGHQDLHITVTTTVPNEALGDGPFWTDSDAADILMPVITDKLHSDQFKIDSQTFSFTQEDGD